MTPDQTEAIFFAGLPDVPESRPPRLTSDASDDDLFKSGPMDDMESDWQRKGATLSDKTARTEFGLTQDEIVQAIQAGKLHYRRNSVFGNPFLRLLRREVQALVKSRCGANFLKVQQAKTELAGINRELKRLKTQIAALEGRKSTLMADLGE